MVAALILASTNAMEVVTVTSTTISVSARQRLSLADKNPAVSDKNNFDQVSLCTFQTTLLHAQNRGFEIVTKSSKPRVGWGEGSLGLTSTSAMEVVTVTSKSLQ